MYCPNCGAQNADDATRCTNCNNLLNPIQTPTADVPPPPGYGPQAPVPNYLIPAILSTLFCCLPAGIVSIVYAAQVDGKVEAGDRAGAIASSHTAKTWAWISFGVGLVFIGIPCAIFVFLLFLGFLGAAAGGSGH